MKLLIAEKALAGKRIAQILSDDSCNEKSINKVSVWSFKDCVVVPLSGHIVNVEYPPEFDSWQKVDLKDLTKGRVVYSVSKKSIANVLKKFGKNAEEVIVCCDYDTEGESIGLEAVELVKEVNKNVKVERAVFSSITNEEIKHAFSNLTKLNINLAMAANARREVDLVWGAVLTRYISLSSKMLGHNYLSVGRVQTPLLRLIVDKELERKAFKPEDYWVLSAKLKVKDVIFTAVHKDQRIFDKNKALRISKINSSQARVSDIKSKKVNTLPPKPFNTTELLREASRIGFSAPNTMRIAEGLYLNGFISYPRTNNQKYPKSLDIRKILKDLGKHGFFKTACDKILSKKELNPSEGKESKDHPPITPTGLLPSKIDERDRKLYNLIVHRFLATLGDPSSELRVNALIDIEGECFVGSGLKVIEMGWREFYPYSKHEDIYLPSLKKDDELDVIKIISEQKQTQPPNRYGHGGIIKLMDHLGLGTKSTRPLMLQKLMDRSYISRGKVLAPSDIALAVVDVLKKYSERITLSKMTSSLESEMESIENGKSTKEKVVSHSRKLLLEILEQLIPVMDDVGESIRKAVRSSHILCKCPNCHKGDMIIITSKRTKKRFVGCSNYPECSKGWPLPQSGLLQVDLNKCKDCSVKLVTLIRKGKRPWQFCPNLECPGRKKADEIKKAKTESVNIKSKN